MQQPAIFFFGSESVAAHPLANRFFSYDRNVTTGKIRDQEYLQLFAFISELSFDVYLKKHMIEMLIDQLREESIPDSKTKKAKK